MWEKVKGGLRRVWCAVISFFSVQQESLANPTQSLRDSVRAPSSAPASSGGRTAFTGKVISAYINDDYAANAKLTWEDVTKIRRLKTVGTYSNAALAKRFNVTGSCIGRIVNHKSWRVPRTKKRPTLEKSCEYCGRPFNNRGSNGVRIGPRRFKVARFCGLKCSRQWQVHKGETL